MHLDDEDRKLLAETKRELDEAAKLMAELMETFEIQSDPRTVASYYLQ